MSDNNKLTIIFDFDNTLVKSHIDFPAMKIGMARSIKEYGFDFGDEKEIPLKYTAGNIIDEVKEYDERNGTALGVQLMELVEKHERDGMIDLSIDDEVFTMLKALKEQNHRMIIFTNNAKNPTLEVLKRYDMDSFFELVIARDDVKQMKPDKEGIDLIITKLSLERERVVFIGDSWVDAVAAKNADVKFILFREELLDEKKYDIKIWKHITSMVDLIPIITNG